MANDLRHFIYKCQPHKRHPQTHTFKKNPIKIQKSEESPKTCYNVNVSS